jgi:hypothetical protein
VTAKRKVKNANTRFQRGKKRFFAKLGKDPWILIVLSFVFFTAAIVISGLLEKTWALGAASSCLTVFIRRIHKKKKT